jgi:hypothetical protein
MPGNQQAHPQHLTIARFYAEQMGFDEPDYVPNSRMAVSSVGTSNGASNHLRDDVNDANDSQKSRSVRAKCLSRRCPSYDLTVFITRADDESHTHIVLLYDPRTESVVAEP